MSQVKIKQDAFKQFKLRKRHVSEHLRSPHPFITVLVDTATKEVLCLGRDREQLAKYADEKNWINFEMKDFPVII